MALSAEERRRLGRRIREAREYLGLSPAFVAEQLGTSPEDITAIEIGRREVTPVELERLARLLKRPVERFMAERDESPESVRDAGDRALFRAARDLSDHDRQQVLRFAEFLREAGPMPARSTEAEGSV